MADEFTNTIKEIPEVVLLGILKDLEEGMNEDDAGALNKSRATYYRWKKEIPKFAEMIQEAKLRYKKRLINAVTLNSIKSGRVGLEVLRRRYPKEWNVPQKIDLGGKVITAIKVEIVENGEPKSE
jgi:hypothetical protein